MTSDRPGVCLVQVPPFVSGRPGTGAQVVATEVVRALATCAEVTVLHGFTDDTPPAVRQIAPGVRAAPAFRITPRTLRGAIAPDLTPVARRALDDARLLVTMECTLTNAPTAPRLVCLGGFGYTHTFELLDSGCWDRLVVPSSHLGDLLRRRVADPDSVQVIENGIDLAAFAPRGPTGADAGTTRPAVRLLVPARPDAIKGARQVLDLARALADDGRPVVVQCLRPRRGSAPVDPSGGRADVTVQALPWRDRAAMPELYRQADLTVCFSGIPEGFGLAAVESVACGTPVLAWPAGALGGLFPPGHGMFLTEREATPAAWAAAARTALTAGTRACRRGRQYARDHYDAALMASRYRTLVTQLLPA